MKSQGETVTPTDPNPPRSAAPVKTGKQSAWRQRLRAFWLKVHLYLALGVGAWFVLLGLTGACNVFYFELEELGLPKVQQAADGVPPTLDEVMHTVRAAHPQRDGGWQFYLPGEGREYLWAVYPMPAETADEMFAPFRVVVDPVSGERGAEHFWGKTPWSLIYMLHASLLLGKLGSEIGMLGVKAVSFVGVFLFLSTATGLYLWWPRQGKFRQALSFKRGASAIRFNFDLHKTLGFYSALLLLILAFTGFSFGYKDYIKPVLTTFSTVEAEYFQDPAGLKSTVIPGAEPIAISLALAIADRIFPDAELRWLATPDGPEGVYAIEKRQPGEANRRRPRSKVWIDQYSGQALAVEDPGQFSFGETFLNLMWPLHNGEVLGLLGRILWCLAGFAPLVLYITGLRHWLAKRRASRQQVLKKAKTRIRKLDMREARE